MVVVRVILLGLHLVLGLNLGLVLVLVRLGLARLVLLLGEVVVVLYLALLLLILLLVVVLLVLLCELVRSGRSSVAADVLGSGGGEVIDASWRWVASRALGRASALSFPLQF